MERERLTPGRIRDFKCPAGTKQAFLFDTDAPRLAVRATAGAKSFVFEAKLNRQTIRVTIGSVEAWPLEDVVDKKTKEVTQKGARQEARRLQTLVDQGIDPRELDREQKAAKVEAERAKTEERERNARIAMPALDAWSKYVAVRSPNWSASHLSDNLNVAKEGGEVRTRGRRPGDPSKTLPGVLRPLLALPLGQIDADRVSAWMAEEAAKRPTHTRLAFGLLRAFLNWCADRPEYRDQVQQDACATRIARDKLPKKAAKDDCLQREQLPLWFEHVIRIPNPVISAYLQALLLVGARREELAGLKWVDVDFRWKMLTIKDKVEGLRTIPLTPYVAALLAPLPRRNEWVFSSPAAASGRLQEPRIAHNKALTAAGLPDLSLHGLRRSFGSLAEWVECPAGVVAQIQGHKPSATAEKHYRVRPIDLLRMWHERIEAWILNEAGIEQPNQGEVGAALRVVG